MSLSRRRPVKTRLIGRAAADDAVSLRLIQGLVTQSAWVELATSLG